MTDANSEPPRPGFTSVYRLTGARMRLYDAGRRIPREALRTRAWEAVYEALNADADFRRELAAMYTSARPSLPQVGRLRTERVVLDFTRRWQLHVQDVLDAILLSHISESTEGAVGVQLFAPLVVHAGAPPPQELSLQFTYDLSQETPKQARRRLTALVREIERQMDALERRADMVPVPAREGWDDLRVGAARWVAHLKGFTVAQIADRDQVSTDAVKSGLRRWRQRVGIARASSRPAWPRGAFAAGRDDATGRMPTEGDT